MIVAALAVVCWWPAPANASVQEVKSPSELTCLAKAIYFEARGEPEAGQYAVGQVILNRLANKSYPSTICEVVYQNAHRQHRCQFSFACDNLPDVPVDVATFLDIEIRALQLLACRETCLSHVDSTVWRSTHYHADYVQPSWSKKLNFVGRIGQHLFYRSDS